MNYVIVNYVIKMLYYVFYINIKKSIINSNGNRDSSGLKVLYFRKASST